jgi:hypothetical protein
MTKKPKRPVTSDDEISHSGEDVDLALAVTGARCGIASTGLHSSLASNAVGSSDDMHVAKMARNKLQPGAYRSDEVCLMSGLIYCGECAEALG